MRLTVKGLLRHILFDCYVCSIAMCSILMSLQSESKFKQTDCKNIQ